MIIMSEKMLKIAIKNLTFAFDEFVGECLDEKKKPKQPSVRSLYKARGTLPSWCENTIVKGKNKF